MLAAEAWPSDATSHSTPQAVKIVLKSYINRSE
jgi:hypothetical protein